MIKRILLFLTVMTFTAGNVHAAATGPFTYSAPVAKRIVERSVQLSFLDQSYLPPAQFMLPVQYRDFSYLVPEETCLAQLSALVNDDRATHASLIEEETVLLGRTPDIGDDQTRAQVQDLLVGNRARLQRLLTVERYSVIVLDIVDGSGQVYLSMGFPFSLSGGKWKICSSCSVDHKNPVYDLVVRDAFDFAGTESVTPVVKLVTPVPHL